MKSTRSFTILVVFLSFLLINCSPSNDYLPTKREIISNGKWQVEYFSTGIDRTSAFQNFEFEFNINGTLTCTQDNNTVSGLWNIADDNVLQIHLDTKDNLLLELNKDWGISEQSMNQMSLEKSGTQPTQLRIRKI